MAQNVGSLDAFAQRVVQTLWPSWNPLQQPASHSHAMAAAPDGSAQAPTSHGPSQSVTTPSVTGTMSDALWDRLASLVDWRSRGLLSDDEFQQAKRKLGL